MSSTIVMKAATSRRVPALVNTQSLRVREMSLAVPHKRLTLQIRG